MKIDVLLNHVIQLHYQLKIILNVNSILKDVLQKKMVVVLKSLLAILFKPKKDVSMIKINKHVYGI